MAKPALAKTTAQAVAGITNSVIAQTGGEIVIQRVTYSLAGQAIAVRVRELDDQENELSNNLYYLYNDHLGSTATMSTIGGGPVTGSTARYTPFGDWRTEPTANLTDRGFTGHMHNNLGSAPDDIGLIYMNARWFSPVLGRFISPDTIVPDPANPQSLNRYSYVLNSPLNFTDPSGHRPSDGCDYEGCLTDRDNWESNLTNYNIPVLFEQNERQKLQEQRDGWLRQSCISQGAGCSSDMKFRFFGIPSTEQHWNTLIGQEAYRLCHAGDGACTTKQVGIMLSTIMLPLAPIFNLGWKAAALPTAFEFLDAASRGYYESAAEEVGFDLVGNTLDDVGLTPYGGIGIGAIDIAMDVNGLSDLELKYVSEARQNVPLQVNQAETAFMNAHLASHGIFPWNRPRPSIYE